MHPIAFADKIASVERYNQAAPVTGSATKVSTPMKETQPPSTHKSWLERLRSTAWLIWSLAAFFYAYENFLQISHSVISNNLMAHFHINIIALQWLVALYFIPYAFMQIPVGILLDRYGIQKPLTAAVLLCAFGTLLFSISNIFLLACIGRVMIGLGSAFAALSCLQIAGIWFPPERFTFMTGLLLTLGMAGQIIGETPLTHLLHYMPWEKTFFIFFILGLILSILCYWLITPNTQTPYNPQKEQINLKQDLPQLLRSKQAWLLSIAGMLVFTPFILLTNTFGIAFLQKKLNLSLPEAAHIFQYIQIGFAIGAPSIGYLADRIKLRRLPAFIATVLALLMTNCFLYLPLNQTLASLLLLLIGIGISGFLPLFSSMKELHPQKMRATALGFMNTLNMLGAVLLEPLMGWILHAQNPDVASTHDMTRYQLADYQHTLFIIPIILLIACCIIPFIRETHAKPVND